MLVVVAAGKTSPGATAAAIALSLAWPREVLLVDADPFGGDVVPGLLPGRVTADAGLLTWATATRREPALAAVEQVPDHVVALPEAPHVWIMPGLQNATQMGAVTTAWSRLSQSLERVSSVLGHDVIVDAGRLGEQSCWPIVEAADALLLTVRPTLRSVSAAVGAVDLIKRKVGDTDHTRLVVTGSGPYTAGQVGELVQVERVGGLPADARTAASLTDGAPLSLGGMRRSRLVRAAADIAGDLTTRYGAQHPATTDHDQTTTTTKGRTS